MFSGSAWMALRTSVSVRCSPPVEVISPSSVTASRSVRGEQVRRADEVVDVGILAHGRLELGNVLHQLIVQPGRPFAQGLDRARGSALLLTQRSDPLEQAEHLQPPLGLVEQNAAVGPGGGVRFGDHVEGRVDRRVKRGGVRLDPLGLEEVVARERQRELRIAGERLPRPLQVFEHGPLVVQVHAGVEAAARPRSRGTSSPSRRWGWRPAGSRLLGRPAGTRPRRPRGPCPSGRGSTR